MSQSPVWNFFKKPEKAEDAAVCKIWARHVKNKGSNTSNLIQHLRRIHPTQYATMPPPGRKAGASVVSVPSTASSNAVASETQPTVKSFFANSAPLTPGNKRHEAITNAITYFLCKDNVPFNTVNKPGFEKLLHVLEPRYKMPNKTTFSKNKVVKLYDVTREAVMQNLNSVDFFASTADMWSSHGLTPYMGQTLHWIDSEWNLQCRHLGTEFVPENHTAQQLAESMNDMLVQWKLNADKQVAITTDNGANIKKACRDIGWTNVSCFGHNLHLAITNTLNNIPRIGRAIGICKKIVAAFGTSWKRRRDLAIAQVQEQPGEKFKNLASVSIKQNDLRTYFNYSFILL